MTNQKTYKGLADFRKRLPGLVVRFRLEVASETSTSSISCKSNGIQLDVIELLVFIHLHDETLHLIHREGHAFLSSEFHYLLDEVSRSEVNSKYSSLCNS